MKEHEDAFRPYLLLVNNEGDVITWHHRQHLPFDAHLQSSGGQQRAGVLFGALLFVQPPLTHVRYHLLVPETAQETDQGGAEKGESSNLE